MCNQMEDAAHIHKLKKEVWLEALSDYPSEGEEERLWHCLHGRAYGINCKKCEREDD